MEECKIERVGIITSLLVVKQKVIFIIKRMHVDIFMDKHSHTYNKHNKQFMEAHC